MSDLRIEVHISECLENLEEAIERGLTACGIGLVHEAHNEIESGPRRVDTGNLRDSIEQEVDGHTLQVGTNVSYAIWVHDGTSRMKANRFLRNAFENNRDNIKHQLEMHLKGG